MSAQMKKDAENLWIALVCGISNSVTDKQLRQWIYNSYKALKGHMFANDDVNLWYFINKI